MCYFQCLSQHLFFLGATIAQVRPAVLSVRKKASNLIFFPPNFFSRLFFLPIYIYIFFGGGGEQKEKKEKRKLSGNPKLYLRTLLSFLPFPPSQTEYSAVLVSAAKVHSSDYSIFSWNSAPSPLPPSRQSPTHPLRKKSLSRRKILQDKKSTSGI